MSHQPEAESKPKPNNNPWKKHITYVLDRVYLELEDLWVNWDSSELCEYLCDYFLIVSARNTKVIKTKNYYKVLKESTDYMQ